MNASLPSRYREPVYHILDDAMPLGFAGRMGEWVYNQRHLLIRGGDDQGAHRFNYELLDVENYCGFANELRKRIVEELPAAGEACDEEPFDLLRVEMHASLYHHGSHFGWHDDAPIATRRLAFAYFMHAEPKMFEGGELEFIDGTRIEPNNNRLVLFHPLQQQQITKVECWSSEVMHGRWALGGWVHGLETGDLEAD